MVYKEEVPFPVKAGLSTLCYYRVIYKGLDCKDDLKYSHLIAYLLIWVQKETSLQFLVIMNIIKQTVLIPYSRLVKSHPLWVTLYFLSCNLSLCVCFLCVTQKPLDRFASNFDWVACLDLQTNLVSQAVKLVVIT